MGEVKKLFLLCSIKKSNCDKNCFKACLSCLKFHQCKRTKKKNVQPNSSMKYFFSHCHELKEISEMTIYSWKTVITVHSILVKFLIEILRLSNTWFLIYALFETKQLI